MRLSCEKPLSEHIEDVRKMSEDDIVTMKCILDDAMELLLPLLPENEFQVCLALGGAYENRIGTALRDLYLKWKSRLNN